VWKKQRVCLNMTLCVCVSISLSLSVSLSLSPSLCTYLVLQFHELPPVLTRDLRAQLVPKGIGGRGGVGGRGGGGERDGDREEVSVEGREYRGVERYQ
jgi:multidrug efflux pump subunit AcrB